VRQIVPADAPKSVVSQQKPIVVQPAPIAPAPPIGKHFTTQQKAHPRSRFVQKDATELIDPNHILDDIQSNFGQSVTNQTGTVQ
jgi:hypothetical protein